MWRRYGVGWIIVFEGRHCVVVSTDEDDDRWDEVHILCVVIIRVTVWDKGRGRSVSESESLAMARWCSAMARWVWRW